MVLLARLLIILGQICCRELVSGETPSSASIVETKQRQLVFPHRRVFFLLRGSSSPSRDANDDAGDGRYDDALFPIMTKDDNDPSHHSSFHGRASSSSSSSHRRNLLQITTTTNDNSIPTTTTTTDVSLAFVEQSIIGVAGKATTADDFNIDLGTNHASEEEKDDIFSGGGEGAMIDDDNFNIDLDIDINSNDVDNIEEEVVVDEHYKEEDDNDKDRITIIHEHYKPNKPYRPPKV